MPLEIKELHIRVSVNQPSSAGNDESIGNTNLESSSDQKLLVQHCVEQVIDIINNKRER